MYKIRFRKESANLAQFSIFGASTTFWLLLRSLLAIFPLQDLATLVGIPHYCVLHDSCRKKN